MSKEYDNTNRGASFINNRKDKPTQPDLTGKINIEGVEYRISTWKQESPKAGKYLSHAVSRIEDQPTVVEQALQEEEPF
jgi:hypothetical protein